MIALLPHALLRAPFLSGIMALCAVFNRWDERATVARTTLIYQSGQTLTFTQKSGVVHAPFAADVRIGKVQAIDVFYI